jgi:APA family basic amino acid/polyamine antiporter
MKMAAPTLQAKLTSFDVTNLVVGAIIGADIYVASSFGAAYLGPSSLLVWVVAGVLAIVIALCFAQCAALLPKVGGPYAYAKEAWGSFAGFVVGWSLWLAEWVSLAVFPVAFVRYLMFFTPNLDWAAQTVIKGVLWRFWRPSTSSECGLLDEPMTFSRWRNLRRSSSFPAWAYST